MYKNLIWDVENNIGVLKINSPKTLNALNTNILCELENWVDTIDLENIKAVIITGVGKAFVAGADIKEMSKKTPQEAKEFAGLGVRVFRKIEQIEVPVIASVNGYALGGGCELAMSCDFIIAGEKARFGQPEVGLGIIPGFSGTQRLPRLIGVARAKELIYTGRVIKADIAKEIGLVNYVVEQEKLEEKSILLANEISKSSKLANSYAKSAINTGMQMDIDSAIEFEKNLFAMCFSHEDQRKRMEAFLNKNI